MEGHVGGGYAEVPVGLNCDLVGPKLGEKLKASLSHVFSSGKPGGFLGNWNV